MTREEIRDFLDVNSKKDIIDYIFNIQSELEKAQRGLDVARSMIGDMVSRDRYNDLLKRYNELEKKKKVR